MAEALRAEAKGAARASPPPSSAWPGWWQAALTALLSGAACWWLLADLAARGEAAATAGTSELAEVADADRANALATLTPATAAGIGRDGRACASRLAWVVLAGRPGSLPGQVRLRSGTYYSPVFTLADAPIRVAIPYPAPYEAGRGALSLLGNDATVALTPPWHASASAESATRIVTWQPAPGCKAGNG